MWKEKPDRSRKCFIRWEHLLPTGGKKYAPGWVSNPATILTHSPTPTPPQPEPHPGKAVKMWPPSPSPPQTPQHVVPGLEMVPISHCAIFLRPAISVFWKSNASWPFYTFCYSVSEAAVWKWIRCKGCKSGELLSYGRYKVRHISAETCCGSERVLTVRPSESWSNCIRNYTHT